MLERVGTRVSRLEGCQNAQSDGVEATLNTRALGRRGDNPPSPLMTLQWVVIDDVRGESPARN